MAENPGYHYFHDKVGDGAPKPEHKPIAVTSASSGASAVEDTALTISNFAFMDDDDVVKVYIALEGDLDGVTMENVEFSVEAAKFDPVCSMLLHVRGRNHLHRRYVSHLMHIVVPEECKVKVLSKKAKLIVSLKKHDKEKIPWEGLRAKVCLPYRRGGGG